MKKLAISGLIALNLLAAAPVFAQENVGLLPTNPFYFLKEWGRSFRQAIVTSVVKKAAFGLRVQEEKLAELQRMVLIASDNEKALSYSVAVYREHLQNLAVLFGAIVPNSAGAGQLLNDLSLLTARHYGVLNDLRIALIGLPDVYADLGVAQEDVLALFGGATQRLTSASGLRELLTQALTDDRQLWQLELVYRLEEYLGGDYLEAWSAVKENLETTVAGQLEGNSLLLGGSFSPQELLASSADWLIRLYLIDEIREYVLSGELKNRLNGVRQQIIEQAEAQEEITLAKGRAIVDAASALIAKVEGLAADLEGASLTANGLLSRASFQITQARQLLDEGNYAGAVGQASSARAAAEQALRYILMDRDDIDVELQAVRSSYDRLVQTISDQGLKKEDAPDVFVLLNTVEKNIIKTSSLFNNGGSVDSIESALRVIKVLLATIVTLVA